MALSGFNPFKAYRALFVGVVGSPFFIGETIRQVTPLILTGLSVAFAFRAGLFNIGAEGQLFMGWFASVFVGIFVSAPAFIHLPMALLAAAAAGAIWGFIPGILKARLKVHEVVVTIMLNYVALYMTSAIIRHFMKADIGERTPDIQPTASLASDFLANITQNSRLHWGILVALIAAAVMWFIFHKTTMGFEMRSVGFSPDASHYSGMNVSKNITLSMTLSGAFSGLAGAMLGLGTYGFMTINASFTNIGFTGIAVALLGSNNAIGVIFAAILFGGLQFGAGNMQAMAGVPAEIIKVVMALIILFVGASYLIRWILTRFIKEDR